MTRQHRTGALRAAARRRPAVLTVIAGLAVVAAGGCATVPASGQPRLIKVSPNSVAQGEEFPQLIPAPPGNHWTPNQIVSGFLVASAGFADTVAREYLGPGAQNWKPGWAVTVVSQPIVKQPLYLPHLTGQLPGKTATVEVSGQELATLTASGQYQVPPASTQQKIRFSLKKVRGQWRITNPPQRLILSKADFLRVYQPRNLYFFTLSGGTLVPDPVFVPLQATTTDLAGGLVNALKQRPLGYLQGVTQTKFPPDTRVLGVRIAGSGATVNLGGSIARATPVVLASVTAQIVWTLTSPSYGRSAISSVRLEINGRPPQGLPGSAGGAELLGTYARLVPEPSVGAGLFFVGSNGAVELLSAAQGATAAVAAHGQAGTGLVPMKAIAVSPPDDQFIAGLSPDGRVVRFGALTKGAVLGSWRPGGHSTSLSWDRHGNLWVATTHGVWLRPPGRKPPIAVDVGLPPGDRVSVLRVAPDGLRVAVIVRGQTSPQILIGAVTRGHNNTASISQLVPIGQGIPDPTALSWYDADNLIVLTNPGTARARLERVPVNGGQPVEVEPEQHIVSLATAGTQAQLVAGLRSGRLVTFAGNAAGWGPLSPGQYPAYPG